MRKILTKICFLAFLKISLLHTFFPEKSSNFKELEKIFNKNLDKQRNDTLDNKSKFKNYLLVSKTDLNREDYLNKFLSKKINQYSEELNVLTIPEYRGLYKKYFKIVKRKYISDFFIRNKSNTKCSLNIEYESTKKITSVCPWDWANVTRDDIFPFQRPNAFCNCNNCLAKTKYDSGYSRRSFCNPNYSIIPALIREPLNNSVFDRWWFIFEEIPTSCFCSIQLNVFF